MKKFLALLLALIMVMSLVACAAKTETAAETAAEETAAPAEEAAEEAAPAEEAATEGSSDFAGQTLKISAQDGGYGYEYWEKMGEAFKAYYPDVEIEVQADPKIGDIVRPQIIAGEFPDLYSLNYSDIMYKTLVESKMVENLADVFDAPMFGSDDTTTPLRDYLVDGVLELNTLSPFDDDKSFIAAAPLGLDYSGMYYNKTLFDKYGWEVPTTWDEFFALGDEAAKEGIALYTYPGMYPSYNEITLWPAIASSAGMDAVEAIRNYEEGSFNNEGVMYVLKQFEKIATGGYLMEGTVALNHTQSQSEFMLDKALFIPNGGWLPNEMADAPRTENFEWALTPAPVPAEGDPVYVRCSGLGPIIPSQAEHKELAKEFLRFMYTDEAVRIQAEATITAARKDLVEVAGDLLNPQLLAVLAIADKGTAFSFEFAPAAGTKIVVGDEVFNPISDLMNGTITAEQWAESVEAAFAKIRAGE